MADNTYLPLSGKTAIVTGASRGIGEGIALKLAQDGADVVLGFTSESSAPKIDALRATIPWDPGPAAPAGRRGACARRPRQRRRPAGPALVASPRPWRGRPPAGRTRIDMGPRQQRRGRRGRARSPGSDAVASDMPDGIPAAVKDPQRRTTPLGHRFGTVREIADVVAWLAGEVPRAGGSRGSVSTPVEVGRCRSSVSRIRQT